MLRRRFNTDANINIVGVAGGLETNWESLLVPVTLLVSVSWSQMGPDLSQQWRTRPQLPLVPPEDGNITCDIIKLRNPVYRC